LLPAGCPATDPPCRQDCVSDHADGAAGQRPGVPHHHPDRPQDTICGGAVVRSHPAGEPCCWVMLWGPYATLSHPVPRCALLCRAVPCRAVPCRAVRSTKISGKGPERRVTKNVPCCAMLCHAVHAGHQDHGQGQGGAPRHPPLHHRILPLRRQLRRHNREWQGAGWELGGSFSGAGWGLGACWAREWWPVARSEYAGRHIYAVRHRPAAAAASNRCCSASAVRVLAHPLVPYPPEPPFNNPTPVRCRPPCAFAGPSMLTPTLGSRTPLRRASAPTSCVMPSRGKKST